MTIPELTCPKCQNVSLFPYVGKEYHKVYLFYKDVWVKCNCCEYKQKIVTVLTRTKDDW